MLYDRVKKICSEQGISVRQLEQACGIGNATIRCWNKSAPKVNNLARVAEFLNVPIDELAAEVNDTSKIRNKESE